MILECVQFLQDELAKDPDLTLRQLANLIETSLQVTVCPQTVKNHLVTSLIIMKQFHEKLQDVKTPRNKLKRQNYPIMLQRYQAAGITIIYMDETNFNLWSTRTRGWSRRGQRAVKKVFAGGGQNLQVIACIDIGGVVHYELRYGGNKYLHSNEFIRATLPKFTDLSSIIPVLDNAPCHARAVLVFEEKEFSAATLLRLGPYSPIVNPIENVFQLSSQLLKTTRHSIAPTFSPFQKES